MKKSELQQLIREVIDEISMDAAVAAQNRRHDLLQANPDDPDINRKARTVTRTASFKIVNDPNTFVYISDNELVTSKQEKPFSTFKPDPQEPKSFLQKTADIFKKKEPYPKTAYGTHPIFANIKSIKSVHPANSMMRVLGEMYISDMGGKIVTKDFIVNIGENVGGKITAMMTLQAPVYRDGKLTSDIQVVQFLSTEHKLLFAIAFYKKFASYLMQEYGKLKGGKFTDYEDFMGKFVPPDYRFGGNYSRQDTKLIAYAKEFINSFRADSQLVKNKIAKNAIIFKAYDKPMKHWTQRTSQTRNQVNYLNNFFKRFALTIDKIYEQYVEKIRSYRME